MTLDRPDRDVQPGRDLGITQMAADGLQYLGFPL
jgi:hypothetical protein